WSASLEGGRQQAVVPRARKRRHCQAEGKAAEGQVAQGKARFRGQLQPGFEAGSGYLEPFSDGVRRHVRQGKSPSFSTSCLPPPVYSKQRLFSRWPSRHGGIARGHAHGGVVESRGWLRDQAVGSAVLA